MVLRFLTGRMVLFLTGCVVVFVRLVVCAVGFDWLNGVLVSAFAFVTL